MSFINSIFDLLRFNKRNWKAVVLCIFAATVFWFFNALNKDHSANVAFPIAFEYNQEKYVAVSALPEEIKLNVTGSGWNLLRKISGLKVAPVVIPLEKPAEVKKIVGASLPALFSSQLEGLQVNYVLADTVLIDIASKVKKKIFLTPPQRFSYLKPGYGISTPVKITPDTIWIEGADVVLHQLPDTVALTISTNGIDEPFSDDVEVLTNNPSIKRNPPTVHVEFGVELFTEVTNSVRLEFINKPSNIRGLSGKKSVEVKLLMPQREAARFHSDSALAIVDLKNFNQGDIKLAPVILGLPLYSRVLSVDSVRIKF